MAVVPMKRIFVCALKKDRKSILEMLQRLETVQIENFDRDKKDDVFEIQDKSEIKNQFERNAQTAAEALSVLNNRIPEKKSLLSSLEGREALTVSEYEERVKTRDGIMDAAQEILKLDRECAENNAEIPKTETQIIALEPWLSYDLPLNFTGTRKTAAFTGTLQNEVKLETILEKLNEYAPDAVEREVRVISAAPEQTCIFLICANKDAEAIQDALRKMGFAKPPFTSDNPASASKKLKSKLEELHKKADSLNEEIKSYKDHRNDLKFAVDYFNMRAEKYDIISTLSQSNRTFLVEGYIPAKNAELIEKKLSDHYDAIVEFSDPAPEEDVPVLLKNNGFASPVEGAVESYSLPGRGEIDPSFIVACFYYILFGIMFSDAAYGIVLVIVTGVLLHKYKNMEPGIKKLLSMFCFCGIGTTFFGFLFGSFFGDAVKVISTTFFGHEVILKPLWIDPLTYPMTMLAFCFVIGILHIFVGLGAKMYMQIRDHQYLDAFYDVILWYMLLGGCILLLMTSSIFTDMMGISRPLPQTAAAV